MNRDAQRWQWASLPLFSLPWIQLNLSFAKFLSCDESCQERQVGCCCFVLTIFESVFAKFRHPVLTVFFYFIILGNISKTNFPRIGSDPEDNKSGMLKHAHSRTGSSDSSFKNRSTIIQEEPPKPEISPDTAKVVDTDAVTLPQVRRLKKNQN